jgi:hypothetical protein
MDMMDDMNMMMDDATDGFCTGSGMVMRMTGFDATKQFKPSKTPSSCVTLLFDSMVLDTPTKFWFAWLGVVAWGILAQYLGHLRLHIMREHIGPMSYRLKAGCMALYVVQTTLSYGLMLVAMTYSSELFFAVILGLSIGYGLFLFDEPTNGIDQHSKSAYGPAPSTVEAESKCDLGDVGDVGVDPAQFDEAETGQICHPRVN